MGYFPFYPDAGNITLPVPIADGGTGEITAAAAFAELAPLTTEGDLIIENATPAPARLAIGAANQVLGTGGGTMPAWQADLYPAATTGAAGYVLVNGTGTIISVTAPNDGNLHLCIVSGLLHITTIIVGGQIVYGVPGDYTNTLLAGSEGTGWVAAGGVAITMQPGTTLNMVQNTAVSSGAAVLYASLWLL